MPLADKALPKIDAYAAQRVLAPRFMNNVVQRLIHRDGMGITEAFSDNVMAAQVRIIRQKLPTQTSRTLGSGSGYNDGHFNVLNPEQPITQEYELPLLERFDRNVDIADVLDDMIALNALNMTFTTLEQRLAQIINSYTIAVKLAAALEFENDSSDPEFIEYNVYTDSMTDKIAEAHSKLDEGAIEHGIDTFPDDNRIVVTNTKAKYQLLTVEKSVYNVGSSRGVELLEIGSAGGTQVSRETDKLGFFGFVHNAPLHMVAPVIFHLAEDYLGLGRGQLDKVYGIVSASQATGRGIAFEGSIKVIDNPRGSGYRLQPRTRWGVETWIPEGVRLIVALGFHNPLDGDDIENVSVKGPDSIDAEDKPDHSKYYFIDKLHNYTYTADTADSDGTAVPFSLGVVREGEAGYSNVRVNFEKVEGPGDIEAWWDRADALGEKTDTIDDGFVGIEAGDAIAADGSPKTTPFTLNINATAAGVYRVKAELIDRSEADEVIATHIYSIYVHPST